MSRNVVKPSWVLFPIFAIAGLIVLLFRSRAKSPQSVIKKILSPLGLSPQMVKYWTAVSAFETADQNVKPYSPWNSRVLRDSKNLFNIIVPGSQRLQYGEGQTIFPTWEDSVIGLYERVMKPFRYPAHVESLEDLVRYMKLKNYFTAPLDGYLKGARYWYDKLYPNG